MTAFFISVIVVYESDKISGGLGEFYCSSIDSIVLVIVIVLIVRDPEILKSILVLVNNTSRNGRVLKFVLVIWVIKKY